MSDDLGPRAATRDPRARLMPTNRRMGRKEHVRCDLDEIMRLDATRIRRAEIAERLDISQSSVDRIIMRERRKAGLVPPFHRKADRPRAVERL